MNEHVFLDWAARTEERLPWELTLVLVPLRGGSTGRLAGLLGYVRERADQLAIKATLSDDDAGVTYLSLVMPPAMTSSVAEGLVLDAFHQAKQGRTEMTQAPDRGTNR